MTANIIAGIGAEDIYWMAGILDTQGGTAQKTVESRQSGRQGVIYVESKNLLVISKMARMTGSNPEPRIPRVRGEYLRRPCTEHCIQPHSHVDAAPTYNPRSRWAISGAGAVTVLHSVMPHMRTDRGFRDFKRYVIENTPFEGPAVGAITKQLRRLYHLGWQLPPEYNHYQKLIEEDP